METRRYQEFTSRGSSWFNVKKVRVLVSQINLRFRITGHKQCLRKQLKWWLNFMLER